MVPAEISALNLASPKIDIELHVIIMSLLSFSSPNAANNVTSTLQVVLLLLLLDYYYLIDDDGNSSTSIASMSSMSATFVLYKTMS